MSCKVSVIIPVYNAAKYINKIADCLLSQTLKDMEFIFINDASTDNTLEVLYEIERKDTKRVAIINLEQNKGPGGARNVGLQYVSGEYIGFVDSDDLIESDMFECMYNKAVSHMYDIVECGYYNEQKKSNIMLWDNMMEGVITFDKRVKMFLSCGFICTKIFKKEIIIDNGMEFIPKIPLEDVDFLCRIYSRANTLGIVDKTFYYYIDNKNSFSHNRNGQGFFDVYNVFCSNYLEHMKKEKIYTDMRQVIEYIVIDVWFDLFKILASDSNMINKGALKIIDNNLKKYIKNYDENTFFLEKAKKDKLGKAFLVNAKDSKEI